MLMIDNEPIESGLKVSEKATLTGGGQLIQGKSTQCYGTVVYGRVWYHCVRHSMMRVGLVSWILGLCEILLLCPLYFTGNVLLLEYGRMWYSMV